MTNRRERRAQAKSKNDPLPLSQPSRSPPTNKTLLDIAAERSAALNGSAPSSAPPSITTTKISPDGSLLSMGSNKKVGEDDDEDQPVPPWLDTLLYTTSLTALHFTLTVLVHHQYSPNPPALAELFYHSTLTSGTPLLLALLVYILHPRSSQLPVQALFAVASVVAGCWLVRASNKDGYMAVMKKAPPLGVVWVWAVVELRWDAALVGLSAVAGYAWWNGYGFT